jgi:hypothetical protein
MIVGIRDSKTAFAAQAAMPRMRIAILERNRFRLNRFAL